MTLRIQPLVLPILALTFLGSRGAAEEEAAVLKVFCPCRPIQHRRSGRGRLGPSRTLQRRARDALTVAPRSGQGGDVQTRPAVGHVLATTKFGQSYPLPSERRLPGTSVSGGDRNRTMYSEPAVAVVSKMPNEEVIRTFHIFKV